MSMSVYNSMNKDPESLSDSSKRFWAIAVVLCFAPMIYFNIISTNGQRVNSDNNPSFITPDGVTFSIWGLIYLFQTFATVYQVIPSNLHLSALVAARPWICLAFIANALWLNIFGNRLYWLSFFDIVVYLVSLIQIYRKLDIQYGAEEYNPIHQAKYKSERHSWHLKTFVFTGFSLNLSWVAVATGLNLTICLRQEGWQTMYGTGGSVDWAIMWAVIFGLIASYNSIFKGDVPYAAVTAWALQGIVRMQTNENATRFPVEDMSKDLALWASIMSYIVFGCMVVGLIKNIIEIYIYRKTQNVDPPKKSSDLNDVLAI